MKTTRWQRYRFLPCIPMGKDGKRLTACEEHRQLSREAAKEGMVLLKNGSGLLPFEKGTRLALFGKGTFDYVKGGGGSGDVTVDRTVNLYEGLQSLDPPVCTEEKLNGYYREYVQSQYAQGREPGMLAEPELPEELLLQARHFTDTALISISRFSGEGWDRTMENQGANRAEQQGYVQCGTELFEHGDFHLSESEMRMVSAVTKLFPKVAVLLNVGGVVDTEWFRENNRIQSVLIAWQGGMEGGAAAAELLFGIGNPSGKLSDSFAKSLNDYPSTAGFHESDSYVDYTEDIYVGYRYFETIPGASEKISYPFGYGLSYTTFRWAAESAGLKEQADGTKEIAVEVSVENTGSHAGKEVIQLYVQAPQGLLGKPARVLSAYRKTRLLLPGERQLLTLTVPVDSMASYDDLGKIAKSAYVLEKGKYCFYLGNSVRNTVKLDYVYTEAQNRITVQLSAKLVPTQLKRRLRADGSYEELPLGKATDPDSTELAPRPEDSWIAEDPSVRPLRRLRREEPYQDDFHDFLCVADGTVGMDRFISGLSAKDLIHLLGGQTNTGVANTYGFGNMPEYNIPSLMTADGPAGLRIRPECGVTTTAFPCATLLSCTWNPAVTFAVGECAAREVKENNISTLLTPAVNIHRSPLCGRNFEYYSEDPYLAGTMAAGIVKGLQSRHIAPSVKHFALNNKETNRLHSDSRVSERAAREIYLKVFEIIVKTAKPWCIMSSYNIINGCRASESRELMNDILREEWGFDGMVCTDWWNHAEQYKEIKAGNDVKMGCGYPERLMEAYEKKLVSREELETCVKRVLSFLLRFD